MIIPFFKYQGTGNDFIIIDSRTNKFNLSQSEIQFLCNRHFGIGADGLITLEKYSGYDFFMKYYNCDGNESTMCGNGGRCITFFAHHLGLVKETSTFMAIDGIHKSIVDSNGKIKLKMQDVNSIQSIKNDFYLNTGSPHLVKFVENTEKINVPVEGKIIRNSKEFFPDGTNVNFVHEIDTILSVRTYERGVEDETLSCGTGSVASAISYAYKNNIKSGSISIKTLGGNLLVHFNQLEIGSFKEIWLEGSASLVFKGEIFL